MKTRQEALHNLVGKRINKITEERTRSSAFKSVRFDFDDETFCEMYVPIFAEGSEPKKIEINPLDYEQTK